MSLQKVFENRMKVWDPDAIHSMRDQVYVENRPWTELKNNPLAIQVPVYTSVRLRKPANHPKQVLTCSCEMFALITHLKTAGFIPEHSTHSS